MRLQILRHARGDANCDDTRRKRAIMFASAGERCRRVVQTGDICAFGGRPATRPRQSEQQQKKPFDVRTRKIQCLHTLRRACRSHANQNSTPNTFFASFRLFALFSCELLSSTTFKPAQNAYKSTSLEMPIVCKRDDSSIFFCSRRCGFIANFLSMCALTNAHQLFARARTRALKTNARSLDSQSRAQTSKRASARSHTHEHLTLIHCALKY